MKIIKNRGSILIVLLIALAAILLILSPLILKTWYSASILQARENMYAKHYARQALLAYGRAYAYELREHKKEIKRTFDVKNWPPASRYQYSGYLFIAGDPTVGYTIRVALGGEESIEDQF